MSDTASAAVVSGWLDVVSSSSPTQRPPRTFVIVQLPPPNSTNVNVVIIISICQEVQ